MDTPPGIVARHRVVIKAVQPDGAGCLQYHADVPTHVGTCAGKSCAACVRARWAVPVAPSLGFCGADSLSHISPSLSSTYRLFR
jgi:hypothetical protein